MQVKNSQKIFNVCVFAGTNSGTDPDFVRIAQRLGNLLGKAGYSIIFGGGSEGVMGAVAQAAIQAGGKVTGVIPRTMVNYEETLRVGNDIIVCGNMHQRKEYMYSNADAFIALPGGVGTLDELIEVLAWKNLNLHHKPIILTNINGYWDFIITSLKAVECAGFLFSDVMSKLQFAASAEATIEFLENCKQESYDGISSIIERFKILSYLSSQNLASEIQADAALKGFDWKSPLEACKKIKEELLELEAEMLSSPIDYEKAAEELGDVLFATTNLLRKLNLDQNKVLEQAIEKFVNRFTVMENIMEKRNLEFDCSQTSFDQMLQCWEQAKSSCTKT